MLYQEFTVISMLNFNAFSSLVLVTAQKKPRPLHTKRTTPALILCHTPSRHTIYRHQLGLLFNIVISPRLNRRIPTSPLQVCLLQHTALLNCAITRQSKIEPDLLLSLNTTTHSRHTFILNSDYPSEPRPSAAIVQFSMQLPRANRKIVKRDQKVTKMCKTITDKCVNHN